MTAEQPAPTPPRLEDVAKALHGSWPVDDPDGLVLRMWSDRGHIDITADQLDDLERLVGDARQRVSRPEGYHMLADLSRFGLLWLINRLVFHPRGFALGLDPNSGTWTLLGDGTEPWTFGQLEDGSEMDDVGFAAAEAFLASLRAPTAPGSNP